MIKICLYCTVQSIAYFGLICH